MPATILNLRQRKWLRLYLGRDDRYHGNATKCYKLAYECTNERVAQSSGHRMLKNPLIAAELQAFHEHQRDSTLADADFVLEQSVRLYDRAMGDAPVEVDVIEVKDGVSTLKTLEKRDYNPGIARQALELIGRHTSVQAFQDNVEHTHTHRLEQALARRGKQVEARAANRIIEGTGHEILGHDDKGTRGEGVERGSISREVIDQATPADEKTTNERGRAQDE